MRPANVRPQVVQPCLRTTAVRMPIIRMVLVLLTGLLSACVMTIQVTPTPEPVETSPSAVDNDALLQTFRSAVKDAEVAEGDEVYDGLTAILPTNDELVWQDGTGRILVSTWTSWDGYDAQVGQEMTLTREIWVTAVPELKIFCQTYMGSEVPLVLRLEQLLGLPPENGKTRMVELWANPADIFRPSPDPEIDDTVAELELPDASEFASQQEYEFHRDWYNFQRSLSYDEQNGYPWTRMGYTYDWGNAESEVGLSEFVVAAHARVAIEQVSSTEEYCTR